MNKNIAIKVQNLTKTYKIYDQPMDRLKESLHPLKKKYHKEFNALNNLNFEIKRGEVVGIIGRNGSGKSTLLKIITGVLTQTSGKVNIYGKISAILELGAGFNPEMTGLENIYLNTSINGMSKKDTDGKINDIVDFAELEEFIHQPVKTYSSGMQARLGFAVAINIEPDLLIVDEALSVGDAAFQRKCFAKIEQIRKAGSTILFVSHSEADIISLCDRAIWISNGQQIIDGNPKLVTGLYMKNSNKKQINIKQIIKEFEELKSLSKENLILKLQENKQTSVTEEFYDSSLKPKSTIYYEDKGSKISDVKLSTLNGEKANILIQGKEYIFSYKVDFDKLDYNILLALLIKDTKGINLGGGHFPARNKFKQIDKKNFTIQWQWTCNLLSGQYFLNCGVSNDKIGFMSRIIDVLMFKVIENDEDINSYGPIDFKIKVKCE